MTPDHSILWRRLDRPGHESLRLVALDPGWHLTGTAVFAHQGQPCRLDYLVVCDAGWRTVRGRVAGWLGDRTVELEITVGRTAAGGSTGRSGPRWRAASTST